MSKRVFARNYSSFLYWFIFIQIQLFFLKKTLFKTEVVQSHYETSLQGVRLVASSLTGYNYHDSLHARTGDLAIADLGTISVQVLQLPVEIQLLTI